MAEKTLPKTGDAPQRIAKLLARAGVASRREIERMIADGRVAVSGVAIDTPATLVTSLDAVTVDGDPVAAPEAARLFLYHKPVGLLVTAHDPKGRPTIYDRLPNGLPRVVPVGRLDLATEGLLLLTTDGELKRQLELPATGVERSYRARTYGHVTQAQLETLIEGIEIEGVRYGQIDANLERRTGANVWIELTLTEGKNREVRRVLEHLGLQVSRLIRTRYGPFVLGDLPPGAVGEVRTHDVESFRAHPTRVDLPQPARRRDADHDPQVRLARPTAPRPSPPAATGRGRTATPVAAPARLARAAVDGATRTAAPPVRDAARKSRAKGPSLGRGSALPRVAEAPAAKPQRAARAAAHRQTTGRADPAERTGPPIRKKGWAKPKPKTGPKPGPRRT